MTIYDEAHNWIDARAQGRERWQYEDLRAAFIAGSERQRALEAMMAISGKEMAAAASTSSWMAKWADADARSSKAEAALEANNQVIKALQSALERIASDAWGWEVPVDSAETNHYATIAEEMASVARAAITHQD